MTARHRSSLTALSVLLLCTLLHETAWSHRSASSSSWSSSEVRGRNNARTASNWLKQMSSSIRGNHSHDSGLSAELKDPGDLLNSLVNASRDSDVTVISERYGDALRPDQGVSPICAYRVVEGGIWGQLCFRRTLFGYKCHKSDCRTAVSLGNLVANILINGSVLLQWTQEEDRNINTAGSAASTRSSRDPAGTHESSKSNPVFGERRYRRGGYELSCWWNGSYTQFECAGVHLGLGCRDFLLAELHENIPYRICLRFPTRSDPEKRSDCVEFTLPPSGMQDIVIAMTTVGGAICVMLVIICLLVAYITENLMSPTTQQTNPYRTHSRH